MLNSCRLVLAAIMLMVASGVLAQTVYRWVDDSGEVHYGHSIPPEQARRGYEILGRDGVVRERVEPALTPEQLAERREERRRQEEEAARQRTQQTRDRILLTTYNSEQSLRNSMEMELVTINSQRSSIRVALDQVEHRFERLLERAAEHSDEGRAVPASLEASLEDVRAELRRLRTDLAALDDREQEVRERYRSNLERYRELMGRGGES
jgi:uncharacterized protein involved in exopolysaccharide biosynthesis